MESLERYNKLKSWIGWLEAMEKEFPGANVTISTAIRSFKSQIKEMEKNEKDSESIKA